MPAAEKIDINPEDLVYVDGYATPPAPAYRPLHAFVSVGKLILNKDDTRQVFEIVTALSKDSSRQLFSRFVATPYGERVVNEPVRLENILGDFTAMRAMPEGSLGKAYVDFMDEAGFTPQGLLDAAREAGVSMEDYPELEQFRRAFVHLEVLHDLWHVLTGYGRDPLGEICNLAFTQRQTKNPGLRLIIRVGIAAIKLERWSMPVLAAVKEAHDMGDNVDFILRHDVEKLLPRPLDEVRAELGIFKPSVYDSIPEDVKHSVLRPKVKKTQSQREEEKGLAQAI